VGYRKNGGWISVMGEGPRLPHVLDALPGIDQNAVKVEEDGTAVDERDAQLLGWWLTTPHKLQGRGALGKPARAGWDVCPWHKPMAAPWQLHAVVRLQLGSNPVAPNGTDSK
jgi:hypothetical protein